MGPTISKESRLRFELLLITDGAPDLLPRMTALAPALSERVAVLLRDKQAGPEELLRQAEALRALTRERGAALLVNHSLEVAKRCEADGVHLPEVSWSIAEARRQLGNRRLVGVSRHDLHGVLRAEREGADYATLAPVFDAPGKGSPLGVERFGQTAQTVHLPLFALGGVRLGEVARLLAAGAFGVAVIREVLAAPEPAIALSALLSELANARSS